MATKAATLAAALVGTRADLEDMIKACLEEEEEEVAVAAAGLAEAEDDGGDGERVTKLPRLRKDDDGLLSIMDWENLALGKLPNGHVTIDGPAIMANYLGCTMISTDYLSSHFRLSTQPDFDDLGRLRPSIHMRHDAPRCCDIQHLLPLSKHARR